MGSALVLDVCWDSSNHCTPRRYSSRPTCPISWNRDGSFMPYTVVCPTSHDWHTCTCRLEGGKFVHVKVMLKACCFLIPRSLVIINMKSWPWNCQEPSFSCPELFQWILREISENYVEGSRTRGWPAETLSRGARASLESSWSWEEEGEEEEEKDWDVSQEIYSLSLDLG